MWSFLLRAANLPRRLMQGLWGGKYARPVLDPDDSHWWRDISRISVFLAALAACIHLASLMLPLIAARMNNFVMQLQSQLRDQIGGE